MINSTNYGKMYVDLDLDMKMNEITKDVKVRTGNSAIAQSIKNIILTGIGERPFNRNFGYGMYDKLFELDDQIFLNDMRAKIATRVEEQEPRVSLRSQDVIIVSSNGELQINIKYDIKGAIVNNNTIKEELTIVLTGNQ